MMSEPTITEAGSHLKDEIIAQLTKERDDLQIKFDERGVALDFWELACERISKERDTLRKHIDSIVANPPPDVQERVIQMLNLVHADAVKAIEKERDQLAAKVEELREMASLKETGWKECSEMLAAERVKSDQLAAKCAEMRECLKSAHLFVSAVNDDYPRVPMDQFGLWTGQDPDRDELLDRVDHALSDQCGVGWLSPEKKKEMEEQHRMEMAAVMTATIQNTESTIKDRIPKENPYWTQAYGDVCTAIDREMKLIAQKKMLVGLIQRCDDYLAGVVSFLPTRTEFKQALEACSQ